MTVMSAKPSDLPSIRTQPLKPQPPPTNATIGPSYNDAFAQFLQGHTRVPVSTTTASLPTPVAAATPQINPTKVSAKVFVQAAPTKLPPQLQKSAEPKVTVVQQKQEEWTNQVLKQSQQKPLQQRVTTERIQPYVSGQTPVYAVQQNISNDNAPQVYYTIRNAPNQSPQQRMKLYGQEYEHNQQFY